MNLQAEELKTLVEMILIDSQRKKMEREKRIETL